MKWTSLKRNKINTFLIFIFFIGLISGICYSFKLNIDIKDNIEVIIKSNDLLNINYLRIIISLISITLSFTLICSIICSFQMFLEGFSTGISIIYYFKYFKLNGLLFAVFYNLFSKFLFIILFLWLTYNILSIYLNKNNKYDDFYRYYYLKNKKLFLILLLIIINEIFISFVLNRILCYFTILIK